MREDAIEFVKSEVKMGAIEFNDDGGYNAIKFVMREVRVLLD